MHPAFLDNMSWEMAEVYGAITDQILINLARHFPFYVAGETVPKSAFVYQAQMLAQMGQVNAETIRIIRNGLADADLALQGVLEQSVIDAVRTAEPELLNGVKRGVFNLPVSIPIAPNQMRAFQLYYQQAADKLNLVNTVMLESTQSAYRQTVADVVSQIELADRMNRTQIALDVATGETVTGVSSWNAALKHATDRLKDGGIVGFVDHAGHQWSAESYVAMDIRTTVFNTGRAATWEVNQDFGNDLYLVSWHNGARPLCYPWQNKVISANNRSGVTYDLDGNEITIIPQSDTSYGQAAGLFGINCKHYPTPFIPGVSVADGTPQDPEENARTYEQSQEQRRLERKLREEKRDLLMAKEQGAPQEELNRLREKCRNSSKDIDEFCKKTGRTRHRDREAVYTKRDFPDKEKYSVSEFERKQKELIDGFYKDGGAQQGYTAGQMTTNEPIVPTSIPAPQLPEEVKTVVSPDIVEETLKIQQYQPMTIEKALEGTNPNYNKSWGYNNNCQRCVQAYEMRRRGYNVEALPRKKRNNNILWGSECFENYGKNQRSFNCGFTFNQTKSQLFSELASAPDGARYSVYIKWNKGSSSHVFIAEKVNGVVKYIDPQSNKDNVSDFFNRGWEGRYGFFRMDDKTITTDGTIIKETVKKGK